MILVLLHKGRPSSGRNDRTATGIRDGLAIYRFRHARLVDRGVYPVRPNRLVAIEFPIDRLRTRYLC